MLKLVTFYDFKAGLAIDLSGTNNHGKVVNTSSVTGPTAGTKALYFNGNNSRVVIPPSDAFFNMGAVQIEANIKVMEYGHRHNIVEGSAAFAFFVNDDGSIQGTVNDGSPSWRGLNSGATKLSLNTWTDVQYLYDGFSSGRLFIDGNLVASDFDMRVPIPNIDSGGVHVGNWPPADGVYPMHGNIATVKIWKLENKTNTLGLVAGMQMNPDRQDAWNKIVQYLNDPATGGSDCFKRLMNYYENMVYVLRRNNPAVVQETDKFSPQFYRLLVADPNGAAMKKLLDDYFAFLSQNVPASIWQGLMEESKAIERECFPPQQYRDIASLSARAVSPEFLKLKDVATTALQRTVLRKVDRSLWPGVLSVTKPGTPTTARKPAAATRRRRKGAR